MLEPRASKPDFDCAYGLTGNELLSWPWAVERLEASRNYWIVTTRADGRPHAMPVWGLWWDGAVSGDGLWLRVAPERAYAWEERSYPHTATRFEFG